MLVPRLSVFVVCICTVLSAAAQQPNADKNENQLAFRFVGPRVGNRVASITGIPGDPSTYYAGAASGGVWKSTDGGNRWDPIFDKQPAAAIGALAVAPSQPTTVWAGTGEAWVIRDVDVMGDGIYKSTDAGKTWKNMGLPQSGRIGRIIVHPTNPDIVFACVLGRTTGPQQERGVYRTTDGGQHWDRVLFADEKTGCSGSVDGPAKSAHAVCRYVAGGDAHLGGAKRRARQRHLGFARRRHHLEAHRRPRPASFAAGQDRRGSRADGLQSCCMR